MANIKQYVMNERDEIKEWMSKGSVEGVWTSPPELVEVEYQGVKSRKLEGSAEFSTGAQGVRTILGQRKLRIVRANAIMLEKLWGSETQAWVGKAFRLTTVTMAVKGKMLDVIWASIP